MKTLVKNFIGGKWVGAHSGRTFDSRDPATGEVVGRCVDAGPEDVNEAVKAATEAFERWRLMPAPRRGEILFRVAERLIRDKETMARTVTREMGKVLAEGKGDVQEAIDMAYYMAAEGRRQFGLVVPSELPNKSAQCVREPVGVVGLITPWNFPIAIPAWKAFPALILGNTVVLKPSPETPVTAALFVKVLEDCGVPPGVVNLVLGSSAELGEALVRHPNVALISFTGSTATGTMVSVEAASRHKRVALEMGGKNAIMVMEDADLELAVDGITWSAFGTTGQRCTACSRLIVHRDVKERLTRMLLNRMAKLCVGNGLKPGVDIGPLVNHAQMEKVQQYVQVGQQEGARLLTGGKALSGGEYAKGYFFAPTLFDHVKPSMRIAREEIFGPVLGMIEVKDLDEAIAINNDVEYGLSSSLYTRDINRAQRAIRDIRTALVYVNAGTIGSEVHLPFGGMRRTGNGHREAGQAALDTFSEWKTIYVDYSGRLQRAQIDKE
ncbi:MAG: aldehyde dehydrogenase family protein [Nitrospirae bacterium]|nr:aldehyde dehydrogenase family protein [Nitrospirota bacterium]